MRVSSSPLSFAARDLLEIRARSGRVRVVVEGANALACALTPSS
jgi:hypothetical protein